MQDKSPPPNVPEIHEPPIIVCPLEFERRVLETHGLGEKCDLHRCGPGANAVTRWAQLIGETNRVVILAGLAGALDPAVAAGSAFMISEVVDRDGRRISCSHLRDHEATHCSITSVASSLVTPIEKREARRKSSAQLVDLESIAFVAAAERLGWTWLIVRGVSDSADDSLPRGIDRWVDHQGRVRGLAVVRSILRHPSLMIQLPALRKNGVHAMAAVAGLMQRWIGP